MNEEMKEAVKQAIKELIQDDHLTFTLKYDNDECCGESFKLVVRMDGELLSEFHTDLY